MMATLMTWVALGLMPLPPIIDLQPSPCPVAGIPAGCALSPSRAYVDPSFFEDREQMRLVTLHEIGHLFDYQVMTPRARMVFRFFIRDRRPWRSPPNSPHERFATAYSLCAVYDRPPSDPDVYQRGRWYGEYGLSLSDQMKRNVCNLVIATARGLLG